MDAISTVGKILSLSTKELVAELISATVLHRVPEGGKLLTAVFLRPSKPIDVLILLLQGSDVGKPLKGVVQDSSRILRARFSPLQRSTRPYSQAYC